MNKRKTSQKGQHNEHFLLHLLVSRNQYLEIFRNNFYTTKTLCMLLEIFFMCYQILSHYPFISSILTFPLSPATNFFFFFKALVLFQEKVVLYTLLF